MCQMIEVPEIFRSPTTWEYPKYNPVTFEEYFCKYYDYNDIDTEREYLPIFWSCFYYQRRYRSKGTLDLQKFLNSLDRKKKYFTVVVYDGGIHESVAHLDLKVFSAVGDSLSVPKGYKGTLGDVAIPIICRPAPNIQRNRERDILAGFIGAKTHSIREILWDTLGGKPGFVLGQSPVYACTAFQPEDWARVNYERFKDLMERSIFALCPRGSSTTSFRVCESLQYGCVPVYISDKFWYPWSNPKDENDHGVFDDIGLTCLPENIKDLPSRLESMPQEIIKIYLDNGQQIYEKYFSFEGCADRIVEQAV